MASERALAAPAVRLLQLTNRSIADLPASGAVQLLWPACFQDPARKSSAPQAIGRRVSASANTAPGRSMARWRATRGSSTAPDGRGCRGWYPPTSAKTTPTPTPRHGHTEQLRPRAREGARHLGSSVRAGPKAKSGRPKKKSCLRRSVGHSQRAARLRAGNRSRPQHCSACHPPPVGGRETAAQSTGRVVLDAILLIRRGRADRPGVGFARHGRGGGRGT